MGMTFRRPHADPTAPSVVDDTASGAVLAPMRPLVVPDSGRRRIAEPSHRARVKTAFLIRSLEFGGSERQLVLLATALHERGHDVLVIVFYPGGPLEAELRHAGVTVRSLGKAGRWDVLGFLLRLGRIVREARPDVLHGYLDVANVAAVVMRPFARTIKVVWGVRASKLDVTRYDWLTRASELIARSLSRYAHLVIANSRAGCAYALSLGYPQHALRVIPNGIDTRRFAPDREAGQRVRDEWNVAPEETLIGVVGRLDPMKDHPTFLGAAARLLKQHASLRFVCVGNGDARYRAEMVALAQRLGLGERLIFASGRPDMPAVFNALDVLCSSSAFGEGFSNVIGEAMACGIPCVVTDVGDSAWLVGRPDLVAPPGDAGTLAERLGELLDGGDEQLARVGREARERVLEQFSVANLVDATERAIRGLVEVNAP